MTYLNARLAAFRNALGAHITELLWYSLLLGNKKLSLQKTHRLEMRLRYDDTVKGSLVEKCEAEPIESLVERKRKHAPIVPGESGQLQVGDWEAMLRGTTEQLVKEAQARDSVYLPVLLQEEGRQTGNR